MPGLAGRLGRAAAHPTAAYAVTSYPTAAELATYGGVGTPVQRLYNVGAAQAAYNVRTMRAAGMVSPIIRTDIEPVTGRPFADPASNNALVDGLLAGYTAAGIRNGYYS